MPNRSGFSNKRLRAFPCSSEQLNMKCSCWSWKKNVKFVHSEFIFYHPSKLGIQKHLKLTWQIHALKSSRLVSCKEFPSKRKVSYYFHVIDVHPDHPKWFYCIYSLVSETRSIVMQSTDIQCTNSSTWTHKFLVSGVFVYKFPYPFHPTVNSAFELKCCCKTLSLSGKRNFPHLTDSCEVYWCLFFGSLPSE
jgi:hypothetical protein